MGDLKVNETFLDSVVITSPAGVRTTGLTPTCVAYNLSDGSSTNLTVVEVGNGIYKVSDWTPSSATEYMLMWSVGGSYIINYPYKIFKVGGGSIADLVALIPADTVTQIDMNIPAIKAKTDTISPATYATGTFTTSSASVPADTARTEATNYWNGSLLIPLSGACALQARRIRTFTATTGVFTFFESFTAAVGLVSYVIVPSRNTGKIYEAIHYYPGFADKNTWGGATISATAQAGSADFNYTATVGAPADSRVVVNRICARLAATRTGGSSAHTYCQVYVDSPTGIANALFASPIDVQAASGLSAADLTSAIQTAAFNLITNGASHTYYFFLWVDANTSTLTALRFQIGVGSCATSPTISLQCMTLTYTGELTWNWATYNPAAGTVSIRLQQGGELYNYGGVGTSSGNTTGCVTFFGINPKITVYGTVATDVNCVLEAEIILASET